MLVCFSIDANICTLFQQVCVDECVVDGGVHVSVIVFVCFRGSVVSWQEVDAIWIIDRDFVIELLLLLLPIWQKRRSEFFKIKFTDKLCSLSISMKDKNL